MSETDQTPEPTEPIQQLDHLDRREPARSHRHPVSIGHLVMGVALAGLVAVWALVVGDVVEDGDIRWLMPVPWVLAGVAGLVGLIVRDRRHVGTRQVGWQGESDTMAR